MRIIIIYLEFILLHVLVDTQFYFILFAVDVVVRNLFNCSLFMFC